MLNKIHVLVVWILAWDLNIFFFLKFDSDKKERKRKKRPMFLRIILLILDKYIQIFFFSICIGYSFTLHLLLTSVMHKLINNHVSNEHYCTNSFTFYLETCIWFIWLFTFIISVYSDVISLHINFIKEHSYFVNFFKKIYAFKNWWKNLEISYLDETYFISVFW